MRCVVCEKYLDDNTKFESLGHHKGNYGICSSHLIAKKLCRLFRKLDKLDKQTEAVMDEIQEEQHRIGSQLKFHDFN